MSKSKPLKQEVKQLHARLDLHEELLLHLSEMAGTPPPAPVVSDDSLAVSLYLNLLKRCLTRTLHDEDMPDDPNARRIGSDWPQLAETMIGLDRLDNIEELLKRVLREGVPGDMIETGVWRGGATIFMRGVLAACGVRDRVVWVADSFQGLPPKDLDAHPIEAETSLQAGQLAVPIDEVAENFARYGLLDEQVRFLPGWFRETLPRAPIERLALMRLDGDFYESTIIALEALYPKLSVGGFVIIDDYWAVPGCRAAVDEFRAERSIIEELIPLGPWAIWWQKQ